MIIRSPELAGEVLHLLASDKGESAFRLRLKPDHNNIEWVALDHGVETVFDDEPDADFLLKFVLKILGPLAPEELL